MGSPQKTRPSPEGRELRGPHVPIPSQCPWDVPWAGKVCLEVGLEPGVAALIIWMGTIDAVCRHEMESCGSCPGADSHTTAGNWVASMDLRRYADKGGGASTAAVGAMGNR